MGLAAAATWMSCARSGRVAIPGDAVQNDAGSVTATGDGPIISTQRYLMSRQRSGSDSIAAFIAQWRRQRPDLDPWPLGIIGRAPRIFTHLMQRAQSWLAPLGLGWETFSLIATLRRAGSPYELTPTELRRQSLLTSGAMTNRIDRVEALGLVLRRPDPADRRGIRVRLTAAGRRLADRAIEVHFAESARLLATLGPTRCADLERLLAALLGALENAPAGEARQALRRAAPAARPRRRAARGATRARR